MGIVFFFERGSCTQANERRKQREERADRLVEAGVGEDGFALRFQREFRKGPKVSVKEPMGTRVVTAVQALRAVVVAAVQPVEARHTALGGIETRRDAAPPGSWKQTGHVLYLVQHPGTFYYRIVHAATSMQRNQVESVTPRDSLGFRVQEGSG